MSQYTSDVSRRKSKGALISSLLLRRSVPAAVAALQGAWPRRGGGGLESRTAGSRKTTRPTPGSGPRRASPPGQGTLPGCDPPVASSPPG
eukprot:95230-Pyramimonas_sp.AAC.1